jgi:hypothetical protein
MSASATEKATLRRMVNEPTTATYSDVLITAFIEDHPVPDARGVDPWQWDYTTTPPTREANENWIATYDLNAAAAEIWEEKAAAVACDFTIEADGAKLNRNQVYEQYMKISQRFRSRRVPGVLNTVRLERVLTEDGAVMETTPILDRYEQDDSN